MLNLFKKIENVFSKFVITQGKLYHEMIKLALFFLGVGTE